MTVTREELERRLNVVEQEVRTLRSLLEHQPVEETSVQRGARLHREALASQPGISAGLDKLRDQFGIPRDFQPMTVEEIHQQMIAEGVKPEDCAASREIIAMREE
jgi:hypothetical protein